MSKMDVMKRDIIEFRLITYYDSYAEPRPAVEIYINDENFLDKVNDLEHILAVAEGHSQITGHAPIPPEELYPSLRHKNARFGKEAKMDDVSIFGCDCGCTECWPFNVIVSVGEKTVTWNGFYMHHRKNWDYSELGSFVFDKQQYFQEVNKLPAFDKQGMKMYKNGGTDYADDIGR